MVGQPPSNEETGKAGNTSRLTIVLVSTPLRETNTVLSPKNLVRIRFPSASDRVIDKVSMSTVRPRQYVEFEPFPLLLDMLANRPGCTAKKVQSLPWIGTELSFEKQYSICKATRRTDSSRDDE